ncbi:hypothetical protein H1R20_g2076, partial [Candolleomyces eurysporus]
MPSYLATYEDTSPFFAYDWGWGPNNSTDDNSTYLYSESTYTVTETQGASFSFKFYGTEVSIFGAKRGNHGLYQATLDGMTSPEATGMHTVTITNKQDAHLDIDFVSWKASVGRDDEPLIVNTWQDNHPAFVYAPANAWKTDHPTVGRFMGGTGHASSIPEASVQLTFQVCAEKLFVISELISSQGFVALSKSELPHHLPLILQPPPHVLGYLDPSLQQDSSSIMAGGSNANVTILVLTPPFN